MCFLLRPKHTMEHIDERRLGYVDVTAHKINNTRLTFSGAVGKKMFEVIQHISIMPTHFQQLCLFCQWSSRPWDLNVLLQFFFPVMSLFAHKNVCLLFVCDHIHTSTQLSGQYTCHTETTSENASLHHGFSEATLHQDSNEQGRAPQGMCENTHTHTHTHTRVSDLPPFPPKQSLKLSTY